MENCLFIGNGLNRTLENSISWSDLLGDLATKYKTSHCEEIPLPLEFERIVNHYLERAECPSIGIYKEIKQFVIDKIRDTKLPENAIHKRIGEIKVSSILTTNYDYFLEYVFNPLYLHKGFENNKYLFKPTSTQNNVKFYHLHGMAASQQSICLGYEHYVGIAEKLRGELNSKTNKESAKMRIKQILCGEIESNNTWGEKFYTSNIDIIGFELSSCEIDIWWLITHRAYLYYTNYEKLKEKIENEITFYDVVDDKKRQDSTEEMIRYKKELAQQQKHILLKNNHIKVEKYSLNEFGNL